MEMELPTYLDQHLQSLGVIQSPRLSQQEELFMPDTEPFDNSVYFDEDGEPLF